ncbi:MAG: magnesium transporter [Candidatus Obscuribacterales bacterium]|nr:magnesium transporter [Candidatus Obscuribacterales bacterium]
MPQALQDRLFQPVLQYARTDFLVLDCRLNVGESLEFIRSQEIGERLIYFYVTENPGKLLGVIPTRCLLSSAPTTPLTAIMQDQVVTLTENATVLKACKLFASHKYLAFPIVNKDGILLGVVDINFFRREQLSFGQRQQIEDTFQLIGFSLSQVANKSALAAFRYRFPWVVATICGGAFCAFLASQFEETLNAMIILTFFMTLVLGLGESVSMQSMTVTIQRLHYLKPTLENYCKWLRFELFSAVYLGIASGLLVGSIVFIQGNHEAASVIALSVALSIVSAGFLGLSIPAVLHAINEDSKIAAGPITLALADLTTLAIYLNAASLLIQSQR